MADLNLNKSKLGTKQYWDEFYELEKRNFEKNPNDTGECWFDESNAEEKVIEFLVENHSDLLPKCSVIDLGTGNGRLLFDLYAHEAQLFTEHSLIGLDYSQVSVDFAKGVAKNLGLHDIITFERVDFLGEYQAFWSKYGGAGIVLDKGTLDAIALNDQPYNYQGKEYKGYELYPRVVEKVLAKDGVLLITSCNFSETELEKVVLENSSSLSVWKKIQYPTFSFGGVKGSTICSIAFVKY